MLHISTMKDLDSKSRLFYPREDCDFSFPLAYTVLCPDAASGDQQDPEPGFIPEFLLGRKCIAASIKYSCC